MFPENSKKTGIMLGVGGNDICVFIKIPTESSIAELLNLKTYNSHCEISGKKVSGENTCAMVNLAFTIVRDIAPHIKTIYLEDKSDFQCTLSNGKGVGISMALYEFMFHKQTWYERHFGAYLKNETLRGIYESSKSKFTQEKSADFSFQCKDLQTLLSPLYEKTKTWEEFFTEVYQHPKKCEIIFPWYQRAILQITNGVSYERQSWLIDLYDNPLTELIPYEIIRTTKGGGKTRRKHRHFTPLQSTMSYDERYDLKYDPIKYKF